MNILSEDGWQFYRVFENNKRKDSQNLSGKVSLRFLFFFHGIHEIRLKLFFLLSLKIDNTCVSCYIFLFYLLGLQINDTITNDPFIHIWLLLFFSLFSICFLLLKGLGCFLFYSLGGNQVLLLLYTLLTIFKTVDKTDRFTI